MADSIKKAERDVPNHPEEFQNAFCVYCRNPYCEHAKWAVDKFSARVATQPDRFFNPIQGNPNDPQFKTLVDFQEMSREALRVYMAKQNDWDPPEIEITDGKNETPTKDITNAVDDAAKALAKSKNKDLKIPEPTDKPVEETFESLKAPEDVNSVEIAAVEPEPPPEKLAKPPVKPPPEKPKGTASRLGNTENPKSGIMIGGADPSESVNDPWAPSSPNTVKKVEPGAKIIMNSGKK